MMLKVLSVAILAIFMFAACLQSLAKVQTSCQKPDNAIDFEIEKLNGTIWRVQRFIDIQGQFQHDCARNGTFINDMYEISQSAKDQFILVNLKDRLTVLTGYTTRFDDIFVDTVCYEKNKKFLGQGYVLWTKDGKASNEALDDAVKNAKIEGRNSYEVYQGDDCFKYEMKN